MSIAIRTAMLRSGSRPSSPTKKVGFLHMVAIEAALCEICDWALYTSSLEIVSEERVAYWSMAVLREACNDRISSTDGFFSEGMIKI